MRRSEDNLPGLRSQKAHRLIVCEEEGLSLTMGPPMAAPPWLHWNRTPGLKVVVEPLVRIHVAVGPVVCRIAVELVGSRAGEDVFLDTTQAAILRAVGVGNNIDLIDIIGASSMLLGPELLRLRNGSLSSAPLTVKLFDVAAGRRPKSCHSRPGVHDDALVTLTG